jgi:DNA-binding NarL/FixJ family response regulator
VLARYGVRQARDGRKVGGHLNVNDISSGYCQRLKNVVVDRLDQFDQEENAWQEVLVEDRHADAAAIVQTKLDMSAWLASLKRRDRRVAEFLAQGETTKAAARKFRVSAGRVSQLRRELAASWKGFVGDEPDAACHWLHGGQ